jgi:hypothetical protein
MAGGSPDFKFDRTPYVGISPEPPHATISVTTFEKPAHSHVNLAARPGASFHRAGGPPPFDLKGPLRWLSRQCPQQGQEPSTSPQCHRHHPTRRPTCQACQSLPVRSGHQLQRPQSSTCPHTGPAGCLRLCFALAPVHRPILVGPFCWYSIRTVMSSREREC